MLMNKKSIIKFFLKYILPPILIMIFLTIYNYLMGGGITPFNKGHIIIFLGFFFITSFFWAMTEAVQICFENLHYTDWKGKIVFFLIDGIILYVFSFLVNIVS